MSRNISSEMMDKFKNHLYSDEKSNNTVEKYMRDVKTFALFAVEQDVSKDLVMEYKVCIAETHAISSANSMIAAVNAFLRFMDWNDCCVKQFKVQRQAYCPEQKELTKGEYIRLVNTAEKAGKRRLSLIIQTICGTGIRVSELQYITVESAQKGETTVSCKGKTRTVFIVKDLCKALLQYAKEHNITSGAIFVTRSGRPISRCNIWREMKSLCKKASVNPDKVFPHNLRHLFARVFYGIEKDIAKLADILGHSNINTTRIYIISTGTEHRRRMENMRLII